MDIDGGFGEGGGQILRMATALSAVKGEPVTISSIRANRPKPGLAAQHMAGIKAVQALSGAGCEGLEKGSQTLHFNPGQLIGGHHKVEVGTAGSITLVLQAAALPAFYSSADSILEVTGGTDVRWSPPLDYARHAWAPMLRRIGLEVSIDLVKRGYYPRGGGKAIARFSPAGEISGLSIAEPAEPASITAFIHSSNLPGSVLKRAAEALRRKLAGYSQILEVQSAEDHGFGAGMAAALVADYGDYVMASSAIGERGLPTEKVVKKAAGQLLLEMNSGATLDAHMADQILPYLALAREPSELVVREASGHLKTNAWLVEKMLGAKIEMKDHGGAAKVMVSPKPA